MAKKKEGIVPKKSKAQKLRDVSRVEEQLEKTFPNYTWEDRAMWMQTPKEWLFGLSPLQICAIENVNPLLDWLKDREQ